MIAIVLAAGAALGWGASDYLGGRTTAQRRLPVYAIVALSEAAGAIVLLPAMLGADPPPLAGAVPAVVAGVGVTVELSLVYAALGRGDAFITAPVGALGATLAAVVGVVGGDPLSVLAAVGLVCALLGGGLGSWTSPRSRGRAGLLRNGAVALGAAGAVCVTLSFLHAAGRFDSYWATGIEHATTAVCAGTLAFVTSRGRAGATTRCEHTALSFTRLRSLALVAAAGTSGDVLYTAASHAGALTVVAAVSSLYPAATIALGSTLGGDRATRLQMAGVALALIGTALLGVATP